MTGISGYYCRDLDEPTIYPVARYCTRPILTETTATHAELGVVGTASPILSFGGTSTDINFMNAFAVRIRWKATDFSAETTVGSTVHSGPTPGSLSTDPPKNTAADSLSFASPDGSNGSGISISTKVAIGVIIPIFIIGTIIIIFLYRRRNRADPQSDPVIPELGVESKTAQELDGGAGLTPAGYELDSSIRPMLLHGTNSRDTRSLPLVGTPENCTKSSSQSPRAEIDPSGGPLVYAQPFHQDSQQQYGTEHWPGQAGVNAGAPSIPRQDGERYDQGINPLRGSGNLPMISAVDPKSKPSVGSTSAQPEAYEDEELRWLREEEQKVNQRRERLQRMEELDEERRQLNQRIQERLSVLAKGS